MARQVLAAVLDQSLRLLHPFVPFLTETLWTRLDELAPVRGIETPFAPSRLLVHAQWPAGRPAWSDAAAEEQVRAVQQWCVAIRETRSRYQVAPKVRLECRIAAEGAVAGVLEAAAALLCNMAGLSSLTVASGATRTADSATVVVGGARAYLPGVVDLDKERARLRQQADKLRGQIEGLARKLSNEGFLAKAPADVVAKERASLEAMQSQLATLEESLRELG